jgi:HD superfamily phosphohydrolase YqeK
VPPAALLEEAADGRLPPWARMTRPRREHSERVATLLDDWAATLGLPEGERIRWRTAGWLHDALRDAPADELREQVPAPLRSLGGKLLHGPAAAARLGADGVDDVPLLCAISYHTIGHVDFDELGRALFIADYIEPGRRHEPAKLAALRARMPAAVDDVLRQVLHLRMSQLLREGRPIRSETAAFWNVVNGGARNDRNGAARPR